MNNGQDAIAILTREHADTVRHVARLETASDSIRLRGFSAREFENIVEAVDYIDAKLRVHQEKEERCILPLLGSRAPEVLSKLREGHKQLWSAFAKLLRSVRDIQDGRIYGTSIIELTSTAAVMARLLHSHMREEETVLFPMVKKLLTPGEYKQLTEEVDRSANINS